ncbi:hypothetical protein P9A54_gp72 [Xanthomonas phage vB_Xar_IVIA-DoCa10]|uniref:Uncharacterized protein n=1 Tax=Xanthomonas phage vB_Xar_IVIA-DoCa10 TaxID=2975529 RepID=A0A9X9JNG1_9CAUD|nr:hypothetical protein P9A54_gp72 [Xanthomonas phage vB_Xar_IVIA-DoCa10]UYA99057.1 hypothetical protein IVIADoCa10_72 [Xanthomonas phage vB_Xar_IVIA-DoCa10]
MHEHKPMQELTKADLKELERARELIQESNEHRGPSLEERLERARAGTWTPEDLKAGQREALQEAMLDFINEEADLVKGLAAQGKKNLAREVVRLRALVKTIKQATASVDPAQPNFGHAEAFRLMTYIQTNAEKLDAPDVLKVWNSRDGVTPFIVHIGAKSYEHHIRAMTGPVYDLPDTATHKWVTRTDAEMMTAWRRTLDRAVASGKLEADKADLQRDNLEAAKSWNYKIGLVNVSTGKFTDEELYEQLGGVDATHVPE